MLRGRLLGGLAAGLASLAVVPKWSRAAARQRTPYHLFVLLGGGIDAILSMDPKQGGSGPEQTRRTDL
jgi:hypothetical protein